MGHDTMLSALSTPSSADNVLVIAALALSGAPLACGSVGGSPRSDLEASLTFELETAIPVADEWVVRDLAANDGGEVIVQVAFPERLAWITNEEAVVPLPHRSPVGLHMVGEGRAQVVDRARRELLTLSRQGLTATVIERHPIAETSPLWDAAFVDSVWYVVAGDSLGAPRMLRLRMDGSSLGASEPVAGVEASQVNVGNWGGQPVLGETGAPFRILDPFWSEKETKPDGSLSGPLVFAPPLSQADPGSHLSVLRGGVALPVIDLNGMALLTVIDPTSEMRLMHIVSPTSLRWRRKAIDVALTFTGATGSQRIYGIRRTDVTEVVQYRWWWQ